MVLVAGSSPAKRERLPAVGQVCGPYTPDAVDGYSLSFQAENLAGNLIVIWTSDTTGDWFAMQVTPDKVACFLDAGEYYEVITAKAGDPA